MILCQAAREGRRRRTGAMNDQGRTSKRRIADLAACQHVPGSLAVSDTTATPPTIMNMSSTGALVEVDTPPTALQNVRSQRGSQEVEGDIIWSDEGGSGLRFRN